MPGVGRVARDGRRANAPVLVNCRSTRAMSLQRLRGIGVSPARGAVGHGTWATQCSGNAHSSPHGHATATTARTTAETGGQKSTPAVVPMPAKMPTLAGESETDIGSVIAACSTWQKRQLIMRNGRPVSGAVNCSRPLINIAPGWATDKQVGQRGGSGFDLYPHGPLDLPRSGRQHAAAQPGPHRCGWPSKPARATN